MTNPLCAALPGANDKDDAGSVWIIREIRDETLKEEGATENYPGPKLLADHKDIRKVTSRFSWYRVFE